MPEVRAVVQRGGTRPDVLAACRQKYFIQVFALAQVGAASLRHKGELHCITYFSSEVGVWPVRRSLR